MLTFKNKMTPAELAELTGYTPQTINKWSRRYGWATSQLPGIKGGKARVIHVNSEVRNFILHTGRFQNQSSAHLTESSNRYTPTLEDQLISAVTQLNAREKSQLMALLLREGIVGLLKRLGIQPE